MTRRFDFDHSYAERLDGFYVDWQTSNAPKPELLKFNSQLSRELGLGLDNVDRNELAQLFSGNRLPEDARPLAQVYAGHQFGSFSPQLGDGRALLIGEVLSCRGKRYDIQFKGSGRTPFSRGGDGKAGIGPVLREYLIAEAMHALGIPTTRALAAVSTGEPIWREKPVPGAILTRVASSHIRVGTFQFFASRGETDKVRQLVDYVVWRHYPELGGSENKALSLLQSVCNKQAHLIAQWMSFGFIHGVMNTDNMALSGETIDYGPCAFMDHYDRETVFSSIDQQARYSYGNQPALAQWNLARFAECLIGCIHDNRETAVQMATETIEEFARTYRNAWEDNMRCKLGLATSKTGDGDLAAQFLATMEGQQVDFTLAFRNLGKAVAGDLEPLRALYRVTAKLDDWLLAWNKRLAGEDHRSPQQRSEAMNGVNPVYVPRNHRVEEALAKAVGGDLSLFERLLAVLLNPFEENETMNSYSLPDPEHGAGYQTFCGT